MSFFSLVWNIFNSKSCLCVIRINFMSKLWFVVEEWHKNTLYSNKNILILSKNKDILSTVWGSNGPINENLEPKKKIRHSYKKKCLSKTSFRWKMPLTRSYSFSDDYWLKSGIKATLNEALAVRRLVGPSFPWSLF